MSNNGHSSISPILSPSGSPVLRSASSSTSSVILDRARWARELYASGFWNAAIGTYKRNIHDECGYPDELTIDNYRSLWSRGGIAARIVDTYPLASWPGIFVEEDEDPEITTPFEESLSALDDRLSLWSRLTRADILCGLGHYSVLLLGAPGEAGITDPSLILATPLPTSSSPESATTSSDLLYLTPVAEDRARIATFDEDPTSPRHGLPLEYLIRLGTGDTNSIGGSTGSRIHNPFYNNDGKEYKVHWTRVIHLAEGCLEDEVIGEPRLRSVWNYCFDLLKIVAGGAEAAWKRADPGQHLDVDPSANLGTKELDALEDQIDEYNHGLRRTVKTRGSKFSLLTTQVSSFGPNADALLKLIAGTKRIPVRKLVGSERGELASSQDDENWWDAVDDRRQDFCVPVLRRRGEGLLDRLIEFGYLSPPKDSYEIKWPPRDEDTNESRAKVALDMAKANQAQGEPILTSEEIRDIVYEKEPLPPQSVDTGCEGESSRGGDSGGPGDRGDDDEESEGEPSTLSPLLFDSLAAFDVHGLTLRPGHSTDNTVYSPSSLSFDLTSSPSPEPSWKAVHRAADSSIPSH